MQASTVSHRKSNSNHTKDAEWKASNGVKHERKTGGNADVNNREYQPRYQKAAKKAKSALLDEFTRLTGYHRKSAIRLLSRKPVREVLVCGNGTAVKFKPEQQRPANRAGKRIYTGEVIASLRLIWTFFWYKCGKILAPLTRQQMKYIACLPVHFTSRKK
jgi:hypothetical protein